MEVDRSGEDVSIIQCTGKAAVEELGEAERAEYDDIYTLMGLSYSPTQKLVDFGPIPQRSRINQFL